MTHCAGSFCVIYIFIYTYTCIYMRVYNLPVLIFAHLCGIFWRRWWKIDMDFVPQKTWVDLEMCTSKPYAHVRACMCVCMYVCIKSLWYTIFWKVTIMLEYVYMHASLMYTCMHVQMHKYVWTCLLDPYFYMYIQFWCMYMFVCVCVSVCVCVNVHTHTHYVCMHVYMK